MADARKHIRTGNPRGRPLGGMNDKPWRDALRRVLNTHINNDPKMPKMLDLVAQRCVKSAVEGDILAIREIGDRMDGRTPWEITTTVKHDINEFTDHELAVIAGITGPEPTDEPVAAIEDGRTGSVH